MALSPARDGPPGKTAQEPRDPWPKRRGRRGNDQVLRTLRLAHTAALAPFLLDVSSRATPRNEGIQRRGGEREANHG